MKRQPISFILDWLSVHMNVPDTKFSRNTMKLLNHNASTLTLIISLIFYWPNDILDFNILYLIVGYQKIL